MKVLPAQLSEICDENSDLTEGIQKIAFLISYCQYLAKAGKYNRKNTAFTKGGKPKKIWGIERELTHCILVDSCTVICWTSRFVVLGVLGLFCRFCSIFDGKFC